MAQGKIGFTLLVSDQKKLEKDIASEIEKKKIGIIEVYILMIGYMNLRTKFCGVQQQK